MNVDILRIVTVHDIKLHSIAPEGCTQGLHILLGSLSVGAFIDALLHMLCADFSYLHIVQRGEVFVGRFVAVNGGLGNLFCMTVQPFVVEILKLHIHILLRQILLQLWDISYGFVLGGKASFFTLPPGEHSVFIVPSDGIFSDPLAVGIFINGSMAVAPPLGRFFPDLLGTTEITEF